MALLSARFAAPAVQPLTSTVPRAERRLPADAPLHGRVAALPAEIAFLAAYGVPPAVLVRAAAAADALGVTADQFIRAEGLVEEERFYRCLAHHLDMGFSVEPLVLAEGIAWGALQADIAQLAGPGRPRFATAPAGAGLATLLRQGFDRNLRRSTFLLTTPPHLAAAVRRAVARDIAGAASYGLARSDPTLSAAPAVAAVAARAAYVGVLLAFVGVFLMSGLMPSAVLLATSALLLAAVVLRLCVCAASCDLPLAGPAPPLSDAELPSYTLLVPLYHEARVVPRLYAALEALDYPRAKLDIKFIVEADDPETLAALRALPLGPIYDIVVAPLGAPRTKPRALNVGLPLARGTLVAVFDAEDEPEAGQLRAAAARMRAAPADVACLQARLTIYNAGDSWLSRCFALDFAALFDAMNVGIAALRLPLPLGGTSNHFRTDVLRAIGGWDAWNVTEDADLGLRLARFGYRTEVLEVVTAEEAPPRLHGWFRQRRRWFKGWQQTQMTLCRAPRQLARELGPWRALMTMLLLIAQVQAPLLWPVSTLALGYRLATGGLPTPGSLLDLLAVTAWVSVLVAGVGLSAFSTWLGMRRRRLTRLWPWLPTLFAYKVLVSAAAWASVIDLIRRPYGWDKTEHGLAKKR